MCHTDVFLCALSDLALRNCYLTADLTVKVGDYGIGPYRYKVSRNLNFRYCQCCLHYCMELLILVNGRGWLHKDVVH